MKSNKQVIRLLGAAGVFRILSWVLTGTTKDWFAGISLLAGAGGLALLLVRIAVERRASEAKRQADTK
jgi:hypothetical protein